MNHNRHGLTLLLLVGVLCTTGTHSLARSPGNQGVVAQRITAPRASPKVAAVLWTRRTDHYTLQVVFPRSSAAQLNPNPAVALWLLGANGTAIPTHRDPSPAVNVSEVSYSVPLSAGQIAVAVALKIDDDYYVEELKPLN